MNGVSTFKLSGTQQVVELTQHAVLFISTVLGQLNKPQYVTGAVRGIERKIHIHDEVTGLSAHNYNVLVLCGHTLRKNRKGLVNCPHHFRSSGINYLIAQNLRASVQFQNE